MTEFQAIRLLLENKMSVDYGRLSISDLHWSSGYRGARRYQVYYEGGNRFAENYYELDKAIEKFLELKKQYKPYVY